MKKRRRMRTAVLLLAAFLLCFGIVRVLNKQSEGPEGSNPGTQIAQDGAEEAGTNAILSGTDAAAFGTKPTAPGTSAADPAGEDGTAGAGDTYGPPAGDDPFGGEEPQTNTEDTGYPEPSDERFAALLRAFETPEDLTPWKDAGYSLDADDYADTGGTAQGVTPVDLTIPEGFHALNPDVLPAAVSDTPAAYDYAALCGDLAELSGSYPEELFKVVSLGTTPDGRELLACYVGNRRADTNILITGTIHAREYITADLCMKQMGHLLEAASTGAAYNGRPIAELLSGVCFTFVPMCNPDGVEISVHGLEGLKSTGLRETVLSCYERETGHTLSKERILAGETSLLPADFESFTRRWKANARGVNLNENFNALWSRLSSGTNQPSSGGFKGYLPCSEPETRMLTILADDRHYQATVHYHAMGSILYWDITNNRLREHCRDLSNQIMVRTGYSKQISDDGGGYKDYFHLKEDPAPAVTVEVGRTAAPVTVSEMPVIWAENWMVPYDVMVFAMLK